MRGPARRGQASIALLGFFLASVSLLWLYVDRPVSISAVVGSFVDAHALPGAVVAQGCTGTEPEMLSLGYADRAANLSMTDTMRFRFASLSKPITAAAVLSLSDRGLLSLDETLGQIIPEVMDAVDRRHASITIKDLLRHSGGWDRAASFDPILDSTQLRRDISTARGCTDIAEEMLSLPLDFDPGSDQKYSNLGYCWLEQVIERRGGLRYERYVLEHVLLPMRIETLRVGEPMLPGAVYVNHYAYDGMSIVPLPKGVAAERYLRKFGAAGGWTGTARDYFVFASSADVEVIDQPVRLPHESDHYGLGWRVWHETDGKTITHFGNFPGAFTFVARFPDSRVVVALFNGEVDDPPRAFIELFSALRRWRSNAAMQRC